MGAGDNDVEVKFGGNVGGLKSTTDQAKTEIKKVGQEATALKGPFAAVRQAFQNMFSGTNFGDVATKMRTIRSEMKEVVEGASQGNIQLGILGRTFAEAAEHSAGLAGILTGVAVAMGALYATKKVLEFGEAMGDQALKIEQASQKLGMNTTQVQEWHGVAVQAHMSAQQMDMGFQRLERSMVMAANGGKTQSAAFKELGINVKELKSPNDALIAMSEKMKDMPDGPKKTAIAMQLMGRAGANMIPVLNGGKDAIEEMKKTAEDTGSVMSTDLVGAGLAVDEKFNEMHLAMQGVRNVLFDALAPAIHAIVSGLASLIERLVQSYQRGGMVKQIIGAISAVFKELVGVTVVVGGAFAAFAQLAVGALMSVLKVAYNLGKVMADLMTGHPVDAWNDAKAGIKDVGETLKGALTGAWGSVKGAARTVSAIWSKDLPKPKNPIASEDGDGMDLNEPGLGPKGKKGKKGKKDNTAKKNLEEYLAELDREQAAAGDDYELKMALEQKKLDAIKKFYGEHSKEYQAELKKQEAMAKQHAELLDQIEQKRIQTREKLAEIDLNADQEIDKEKLTREKNRLDADEQLGKISATKKIQLEGQLKQQEFQLQRTHEDQMFQLKKKELEDELALMHLSPKARQDINDKIEELERTHAAKMRVIDAQAATASMQSQQQVFQASVTKIQSTLQPISNGFSNMLGSMLTKTGNWKQQMLQTFQQIAQGWIQKGIDMLTHHIAIEIAKTGATTAQVGVRKAAETVAATTSKVQSATSGMAQISTNAAVGASGAAAATAPIPFIGPALAPAAAAAALAMILGFGAMVASASGGYDIPGGTNPLTQLHEKEMVLPAHIAEPLRRSLRGAGPTMQPSLAGAAGASASSTRSDMALRGGDNHFSYAPQYGGGSSDLGEMLRKDGDKFERWFQNKARNGAFKGMGVKG